MTEQNRLSESSLHNRIPELAKVHYFDELESTNDFGKKIAATTVQVPALIYAVRQTRGRGRGDKTWHSDQGSMTFSFLVDDVPALKVPRFSLSWGLAVAQTLNQLTGLPSRFQVKWPNDVMSKDQKVSGVLIESVASRPSCLVVGIGINVGGPSNQFSPSAEPGFQPISVWEATGKQLCKLDILDTLWDRFRSINQLDNQKWCQEFKTIDFLKDKQVAVRQGPEINRGRYDGVDEQGGLRLIVDGKTQVFHSGSVVEVGSADIE